jgi:AraC-like DNA-binding protein
MSKKKSNNSAYLFMWEGKFLYIGDSIRTNIHEHHALQIAISEEKPFMMRIANGKWKKFFSLIINSDQQHECVLKNGRVYFLSLDPESISAKRIKEKFLVGNNFSSIPQDLLIHYIRMIQVQFSLKINCAKISKVTDNFINTLADSSVSIKQVDERVSTVIGILKNSLDSKIKLKHLAEKVFLSETRLAHLFKEQTGISIRKYLLWQRINIAVKEISDGKNFTNAAYSAGFSDSPHFSKIFKRMFGISPTALLKNSQSIQVFSCNK